MMRLRLSIRDGRSPEIGSDRISLIPVLSTALKSGSERTPHGLPRRKRAKDVQDLFLGIEDSPKRAPERFNGRPRREGSFPGLSSAERKKGVGPSRLTPFLILGAEAGT